MYRRLAHAVGAALISGALMVAIASPVSAQLVVYDAATTARNTVTAAVKQYLFETERQQHMKLREMARRLSALTNLRKYVMEDVPRWRTHGGDFFYAQPYNDALIFGDPAGSAFTELSQRLLADARLLDRLDPAARRLVEARLATVNLTDAAAIAATHGTGQLRCLGEEGTARDRRTRTRRHRSIKRTEHDRGPRQDQWRRPDRRSSAPGSHPVARRHGRTTPGRQQASSGHGHGRTGDADRHVARRPSRGRSIRGRIWRRAQNLAAAVKASRGESHGTQSAPDDPAGNLEPVC